MFISFPTLLQGRQTHNEANTIGQKTNICVYMKEEKKKKERGRVGNKRIHW